MGNVIEKQKHEKKEFLEDYLNYEIKKPECSICLNENSVKLSCNHDHFTHITCILESKQIKCPECFFDVSDECLLHIRDCKDKNCICKNKTKMYDNECYLSHKLITDYLKNNLNGNLDEIKELLLKYNLKNVDNILNNYF